MSGRKVIKTKEAPAAIGPYSQGIVSGDFVFTAGQIPLDPATGKLIKGDFSEQVQRVLENIDGILKVLKKKSLKYKNTVCIGRSHGIHAEPTTFGLKLASFYEEFKRNKKRI